MPPAPASDGTTVELVEEAASTQSPKRMQRKLEMTTVQKRLTNSLQQVVNKHDEADTIDESFYCEDELRCSYNSINNQWTTYM